MLFFKLRVMLMRSRDPIPECTGHKICSAQEIYIITGMFLYSLVIQRKIYYLWFLEGGAMLMVTVAFFLAHPSLDIERR